MEFDPVRWWALIREALEQCVHAAGRPTIRAVVVSSIRQAFLLCDDSGEIGLGIHNADRRGEAGLAMLGATMSRDDVHDLTGHWSAPQMPLPKLLAIREHEPERWARASRLMFVQDWVAWRLTGVWRNERTLATSSQLCEVRTGKWATGLLASVGLRDDLLGEIIDAGEVVGESRNPDLPDLLDVPVVAGGGDAHFLAFGARSRGQSEVVAVAGSTTPIQTVSERVPNDEQRRPWISAGLVSGGVAVEMNAGYTGVALDWLCSSLDLPRSELVNRAWSESGARRAGRRGTHRFSELGQGFLGGSDTVQFCASRHGSSACRSRSRRLRSARLRDSGECRRSGFDRRVKQSGPRAHRWLGAGNLDSRSCWRT